MTTSKLQLYAGACRIIGTAKPASLSEDTETRRLLDDVWDDDAIDSCLEEGLWNFALRTAMSSYNSAIAPAFGFNRVHTKPTDWIRTECIASDGDFYSRLTDLDYRDEAGYFFTYLDDIYIRYVSNDSQYGANFALWPKSFTRMVHAYLALGVVGKLRDSRVTKEEVLAIYEKARTTARSRDAMNQGVAFAPMGSWNRARLGTRRGDRGSRNRLIG